MNIDDIMSQRDIYCSFCRNAKLPFQGGWAKRHELTNSTMEALHKRNVFSEYDVGKLTVENVKKMKLPKDQHDRLYSVARKIALDLMLPRLAHFLILR